MDLMILLYDSVTLGSGTYSTALCSCSAQSAVGNPSQGVIVRIYSTRTKEGGNVIPFHCFSCLAVSNIFQF